MSLSSLYLAQGRTLHAVACHHLRKTFDQDVAEVSRVLLSHNPVCRSIGIASGRSLLSTTWQAFPRIVKGVFYGTNCSSHRIVPVPFDIGTFAPYTINDLAVENWIPYHCIEKGVRLLDYYRHEVANFPTLPTCLLEHRYSVFIGDPLFSPVNVLIGHQLQYSHVPEFRGDVLVVKHARNSSSVVVDIVDEDIALVNLLVIWYVHGQLPS